MTQNNVTSLAITTAVTSALWLSLLPDVSFAQILPDVDPSQQAKIFLNAGNLTSVRPLFINFHPQQITLEEENLKQLKKWVENMANSNTLIHIYSYATPPMARRDMDKQSANHRAMRKAFNRAIEAKNILELEGVPEKLIALHTIGAREDNPADQLHITLRKY